MLRRAKRLLTVVVINGKSLSQVSLTSHSMATFNVVHSPFPQSSSDNKTEKTSKPKTQMKSNSLLRMSDYHPLIKPHSNAEVGWFRKSTTRADDFNWRGNSPPIYYQPIIRCAFREYSFLIPERGLRKAKII
jgi:hypothetical protein